jgi:hypothetical protein
MQNNMPYMQSINCNPLQNMFHGCRFKCQESWLIGLDSIGLDWIGLDWIGLDWIGWIDLDLSDGI